MKKTFVIATLAIILSSCHTYYMTPASLKAQLQHIDPNKITDAYDFRLGLTGVLLKGGKNFYNGISTLKVTDKNGKEKVRRITSHTGIKLYDTKGRHVQLYFDSIFLRDSFVYGSKSHFITLSVTPMNVDSLTKVVIN